MIGAKVIFKKWACFEVVKSFSSYVTSLFVKFPLINIVEIVQSSVSYHKFVCVCVLSGRSHHPHLAYRKTKTQKRKVSWPWSHSSWMAVKYRSPTVPPVHQMAFSWASGLGSWPQFGVPEHRAYGRSGPRGRSQGTSAQSLAVWSPRAPLPLYHLSSHQHGES